MDANPRGLRSHNSRHGKRLPEMSHQELSAVTFLARKTAWTDELSSMLQACGSLMKQFFVDCGFHDYDFWLVVAHGPWQPDTRITRYRKLWKSNRQLVPFRNLTNRSDEILIESDAGLRYAGMVELDDNTFGQAIELLRTDSACFILASNRSQVHSADSLVNMISLAFPNDDSGMKSTSVDWLNVAASLCARGDFVVRVSGLFDDPEATIDLIFSSEVLPDFRRCLETLTRSAGEDEEMDCVR